MSSTKSNRSKGHLYTAPLTTKPVLPDSKATLITADDLFFIAWGFGLSASGGGGSFVDGIGLTKTMVANGFTEIYAASITSAPSTEYAGIAGGMGAPTAIGGGLEDFVPACLAAMDALSNSGLIPSPLTGITPIEAGPVNGLLPVYICDQSDGQYDLYDCDGAGRAVPSLTNLLYDNMGVTFSPSGQANIDGTQTQVNDTWANGAEGEAGLRDVINEYGGAIGLAAWAQSGASLSTATVNTETYSDANNIGRELYAEKGEGRALQTYLSSLAPNSQFSNLHWLATFNEIYVDPEGAAQGYDKGYIIFGKDEILLDSEFRMYFLNENMFISRHSSSDGAFIEYIATGPSTIACFFADPSPPASIDAAANDFIPYNTGDNAIIETLVGRAMIVTVQSPTPYLYDQTMKQSFVTVLNDYFSEPPYGFTFTMGDIFPTTGGSGKA